LAGADAPRPSLLFLGALTSSNLRSQRFGLLLASTYAASVIASAVENDAGQGILKGNWKPQPFGLPAQRGGGMNPSMLDAAAQLWEHSQLASHKVRRILRKR